MIQKRVEFLNNREELLSGIIRIPKEDAKSPAIILCHEFMGNKDNEFMFDLAATLSGAGFITLRFDFAGHGESQGDFKDFTITQNLKDITSAIDFLGKVSYVDEKKIGVVGHSEGGVAAILAAGNDRRITSLACIAAEAHPEHMISSYFREHEIKEMRMRGYIMLHNFKEVSSSILDDINKHDVLDSIKSVKCPIVIIHGTNDKRVPFENARELFNHSNDPKKLEIVEGADHRFTEPAQRDYLRDILVDWFLRTSR